MTQIQIQTRFENPPPPPIISITGLQLAMSIEQLYDGDSLTLTGIDSVNLDSVEITIRARLEKLQGVRSEKATLTLFLR